MTALYFNNGLQQQYRIVAEWGQETEQLALAGFDADEHTEGILARHLQNLCVQSDGSLVNTHHLLCTMMRQWQLTLNLPRAELLTYTAIGSDQSKLRSVCLYKSREGETEKLVNRIWM